MIEAMVERGGEGCPLLSTTGFEPFALVTLYLTDENASGVVFFGSA